MKWGQLKLRLHNAGQPVNPTVQICVSAGNVDGTVAIKVV